MMKARSSEKFGKSGLPLQKVSESSWGCALKILILMEAACSSPLAPQTALLSLAGPILQIAT